MIHFDLVYRRDKSYYSEATEAKDSTDSNSESEDESYYEVEWFVDKLMSICLYKFLLFLPLFY